VAGQFLWKVGLRQVELSGAKDYLFALFNPKIFLGLVIYGLATLVWFYVLKKHDLSKVYPLQSISYIIAMLAGYFLLNEHITKNSIIGTIIICVGVFVIVSK
jgi:drug/metabolite transporter (DMT)-like permease